MWRSKHPTMTIRPELTVTVAPYRATSRHRSASVSAASVGRGVFFALGRAWRLVCTSLWEVNTPHPTSLLPAAAGVRSPAPPTGEEGPGSGSEGQNGAKCPVINFSRWIHWLTKGSGHILQGAHLATVPQSYIRTTA
eukprot:scaffold14790_cov138-Isochrysis_galbana.AAC.6